LVPFKREKISITTNQPITVSCAHPGGCLTGRTWDNL
jgi:hypothetical protein